MALTRILLLGAGKIGAAITHLLDLTGDYAVTVADATESALGRIAESTRVRRQALDVADAAALSAAMSGHDAVISALPYYLNVGVAERAREAGLHYFDLTEDVETTRRIRQLAASAETSFTPQCGLAPGFISIVTHHLCRRFESLRDVRMRVGALPEYPTNALKYNLTWSTDGLINEYCNPCEAIHDGALRELLPLEGLERFSLDGIDYEAFNTSGGLGTLCETYAGKVRALDYKTVRYPGHRDILKILLEDLNLREHRDILKSVLEAAVPMTAQDVVLVFVTVTGMQAGFLTQETYARKIYAQEIGGRRWSAIQLTTAAGVCAMVDLHARGLLPRRGFVKQEDASFDAFIANRIGRYYHGEVPTADSARKESRATANA
ncbi:MAG: saccharopine dehydrogenase NADP-binding domain-containing protein [Candidatus Schekmanbacteria bacterium]|nr:saccharopine dehydrogenase NADP-binding domain-containing protein [Candidatus Schekmanbacteria bacterium]